ncbi:MAG: hypothetical protein IID01_08475 [Chloroflexi bacterium]|nr:hypothetical protein [Chloroflexota bacterium]
MEISTQDIVQECLELLRNGRSLEECLERYPEEAAELEPVLRNALSVRTGLTGDMPIAARTRIRGRVLAEWDRRRQPKQWDWRIPSLLPRLALFPRWAFVAASLVLVLALGGLGTDTAAANAVPGDVLYPVKEFRESVQLWFARSPEAKVEMYTSLVKKRVEEVKKIAAQQQADLDALSDALARMEGHLAALNIVVENKLAGRVAGEVDVGFVTALQKSMSEQGTAGGSLEKALEEVPAAARPDLDNALKAIQLARERVDSALEAAGYSGSSD